MLTCKGQIKYNETGVNMEMWNTFSMYPRYLSDSKTISAWCVTIVAMKANVWFKQKNQIQQSAKYCKKNFFILESGLVLDVNYIYTYVTRTILQIWLIVFLTGVWKKKT